MRIYKMTATFGKLEHATLELKPGMNIITAPNEWGKSTWCAFLVAMLYGLDTRAKTTKTALADKERFAPWSGSPMSGRIDLNWKGRDITIERSTRRRVPLGEFRAYETASGLPVPELTAANCGAMLLGVEQTVFRRAGFIRHADLPVTQDEALRRRLNALVTTGDDSGAADHLAEELKNLKNRCRYNKNGLLPQAEAERDALREKIAEMENLDIQIGTLHQRIEEIRNWLKQLYNHQQTLAYEKMEGDTQRVSEAGNVLEQIRRELQKLEQSCEGLPSQEEAELKIRELRSFREQWNAIQAELELIPEEPQQPLMPHPFTGLSTDMARTMAIKDAKQYAAMDGSKAPVLLLIMAVLGFMATAVLVFLKAYLFAGVAGVTSLVSLVWSFLEKRSMKKQKRKLLDKYGHPDWRHWADPVAGYEQAMTVYRSARKEYREISSDVEVRLMVLRKKKESLCGQQEPDVLLDYWQSIQARWSDYYNVCRDAIRAENHFETLRAMVRPVEKPTMPDQLSYGEEETARLLTECAMEQQRLQNRLGQYQGRLEILGNREAMQSQLQQAEKRIMRLEETYGALSIALETLTAARAELQRRFAPRITRRAQELLSQMTEGRYHSLAMGTDFSLQAAAGEEETLHDALWRSDGTMDQLYLALRLAVAEELTPESPLILDDALVRFDDVRMARAVEILREISQEKQVICFSCQGRENDV